MMATVVIMADKVRVYLEGASPAIKSDSTENSNAYPILVLSVMVPSMG